MPKLPPVITLITDFGLQDEYVGVMKGVILRINPSARIVDLSHSIAPQDILGAAYLLFSAYRYFSPGTVHVVVVDPGVGSDRRIICIKTAEYIFLAPDNGVLSFIVAHDSPEVIIEVNNSAYFLPEISNTFHGRDIFAPVAAHLSCGIRPEELGKEILKIVEIEIPAPVLSTSGTLSAEVIYIDHFGNIITNVDSNALERIRSQTDNRYADEINSIDYSISIVASNKKIEKISKSYSDVKDGELTALLGSSGYLEIAANKDSAEKLLNIKKGDKIDISNQ